MDARDAELVSFLIKFKQLLKSGHKAHVDFDCSGGKERIRLRLVLEEFKPSSCLERKISSKERRRGRRAAAAAKQFNYASVVKSVDSSENVNLKS